MSVGRICSRVVDVAGPDESVLSAARRMGTQRVGTLLVLDEARKPIGMVTDRDLVVRVLTAGKDPQRTPIGTVMSRDLQVIREDSPIETALSFMKSSAIRRLPVVDGEGRLVGILSLDDVLVLLAEEFAHIGTILEGQKP